MVASAAVGAEPTVLPDRGRGRNDRTGAVGGGGRYHSVAMAFDVVAGAEHDEEQSGRANGGKEACDRGGRNGPGGSFSVD